MSAISLRLTTAAALAPPQALHSRTGGAKSLGGLGGLFRREELVCWKSIYGAGKRRNLNMITSTNDIWIRASKRQEPLADDPLTFEAAGGLESTLNNLSKWLVAVLTAAIVIWRHDAGALWAATGAVLNVGLSIALKNILKQERPIPTLKPDPGMPSSHAQTFFYMVTFLCVSLVEYHGMSAVTAILTGTFLAISSYFSWLRVSQQLHTLSQVIVGAIVGSIFCFSWLLSWYAFILEHCASLWVRIILTWGGVAFCILLFSPFFSD